jgi:hypothetical protein
MKLREIRVKIAVTLPGKPAWECQWQVSDNAVGNAVRGDPQQLHDQKNREALQAYVEGFRLPAFVYPKAESLLAGRSQLTADGEQLVQ